MIEVGAQAPDFTLRDAQGNAVSLKDYRGKKVVLYFYPRVPRGERAVPGAKRRSAGCEPR